MPSNINQQSYNDSYNHDNVNLNRQQGGNGGAPVSRVNVRDYRNNNNNNIDDEYLDNNNNNNSKNNNNTKRYPPRKNNNNIRSSDYNDEEEDYNVTNNRSVVRNVNSRSNNLNYNNNNNSNNNNNNNNNNNFDDVEDDEDTYITNNNRYVTRNSNIRPNDLAYVGPAVINSSNTNNIDDDYGGNNRGSAINQTSRRNSTVSHTSVAPSISNTQNTQPVSYEDLMLQRQQLYDNERELLQKKMDEYYPITFIIIYSFIFIILCITIIALQIAMIVFNVTLANIGAGIWCGVYFLIAVGLALSTIFHRQYSLMHASLVMHFFGMFLALGGLVVVNIVAITRFNFCGSLWFNQMCTNRSLEGSHIAMIVFGCICFLLCIIFFSYIQCTVFSTSPIGRNDPYGYVNGSSFNRRQSAINSSFRNPNFF